MKTEKVRRILVSDADYVLYDLYQYWETEHDEPADGRIRISVDREVRLALSDGREIDYDDDEYWVLDQHRRLTPVVWRDFFKYDTKQFGRLTIFWRLLVETRNFNFAP